MQQFIAGRAFVVHDHNVLMIREAQTYAGGTNKGKYDFPGGKVHPGEHPVEALQRETYEECGLSITVGAPFFVDEWRPIINDERIQIIGVFYECSTKDSSVRLGPDHDNYQWLNADTYQQFDLIPTHKEAFEAYMARGGFSV